MHFDKLLDYFFITSSLYSFVVPDTPDDYEPEGFKRCKHTYHFKDAFGEGILGQITAKFCSYDSNTYNGVFSMLFLNF